MTREAIFAYLVARLDGDMGIGVERVRYVTFTPTSTYTKYLVAIKPPEGIDDGDGVWRGTLIEVGVAPDSLRNSENR